MYVTYRSERRKQHPGTTANCPKTSKQRRVRTSFRPRRDTRKRGHEYQFPGRVPLKKPSGVDFLQTSHEISKFPGCTCTQRSMTREIRWRSRSSNAISTLSKDFKPRKGTPENGDQDLKMSGFVIHIASVMCLLVILTGPSSAFHEWLPTYPSDPNDIYYKGKIFHVLILIKITHLIVLSWLQLEKVTSFVFL